ncbi:hypothetical protein E2C01_040871 [Portunus trituberculatus]|uniref:Uncharacterized protein n=1 Tax=Portunus trituberculatus TaxID=210409 RepID=A0A5B7FNV2_PORTR|nr:hypothetical protein [Portunus trituberculatus]
MLCSSILVAASRKHSFLHSPPLQPAACRQRSHLRNNPRLWFVLYCQAYQHHSEVTRVLLYHTTPGNEEGKQKNTFWDRSTVDRYCRTAPPGMENVPTQAVINTGAVLRCTRLSLDHLFCTLTHAWGISWYLDASPAAVSCLAKDVVRASPPSSTPPRPADALSQQTKAQWSATAQNLPMHTLHSGGRRRREKRPSPTPTRRCSRPSDGDTPPRHSTAYPPGAASPAALITLLTVVSLRRAWLLPPPVSSPGTLTVARLHGATAAATSCRVLGATSGFPLRPALPAPARLIFFRLLLHLRFFPSRPSRAAPSCAAAHASSCLSSSPLSLTSGFSFFSSRFFVSAFFSTPFSSLSPFNF